MLRNNIHKLLLFAVTTPTYLMVLNAAKSQQSPPSGDLTYPLIQLALVYLAYEADQQQWGQSHISCPTFALLSFHFKISTLPRKNTKKPQKSHLATIKRIWIVDSTQQSYSLGVVTLILLQSSHSG